jgi:cytochrome c oxidase subunit 1
VPRDRKLVLAHLWLAFAVFAAAAVLGVWQMWVRSPLHAPYENPQNYFLSVTAHGVSMAYVLTTFFVMGFGYFVAETALGREIPGIRWAWAAFAVGAIGAAMAALTILAGDASVLYTFYPPLTASPFFYIGCSSWPDRGSGARS